MCKRRRSGRPSWILVKAAVLALAALHAPPQQAEAGGGEASVTAGGGVMLEINARDDVPASVNIRVDSKNGGGATVDTQNVSWTAGDNGWSSQIITVPSDTVTVRLTFTNDSCGAGCPGDPDADRNAHIDYLVLGGVRVEGEHFDRTGGTDTNFPGCDLASLDGREIATCGNGDDWAEYDVCGSAATVQPDPSGIENNRFLSFVPANAGAQTAIRVDLVDLSSFPGFNGTARWVGEPVQNFECDGTTQYWTARLQCTPHFRNWGPIELLNVYGPEIAPMSEYEIRMVDQSESASLGDADVYSCPRTIHTQLWCDVTDGYGGVGQPNFIDISAVVDCYKCITTAAPKRRCKVAGSVLDPSVNINFQDINDCVSSYKSLPYTHGGPDTSSDTTWYLDADGDDHGDAGTTLEACGQPFGYADNADDCDDSDPEVYPGATETCNGIDDDCDTVVDPAGAAGCATYYRDDDGDTYGLTADSMCLCSASGPYSAGQSGDCDDGDPTVNPGETEACNGKDDDCDGFTDPPGSDGCTTYYRDNDHDGYGQVADSRCLCSAGAPYDTTQPGDCNDGNPSINPAAADQPDDSFVDSNCDGIDGDESRAIFVSPLGSDANPGTRSLPKRRIPVALSAAQAAGKDVYAAAGPYSESSTVKLLPGVSIYSGYDTSFGVRNNNAANRAQIVVADPEAVQALSLGGAQVVLDRVLIDGANATTPGDSAYGVRTLNSNVRLRFSEVRAGRGANGIGGSSGSLGPGGSNGQRGQSGCEDDLFCGSCSRPSGGSPGGSACGRTGGPGGSAGYASSSGSPGFSGAGGTPGGAGAPPGHGNWSPPSTYWGQNGATGSPGANGAPGFNGNSRYTSAGLNPLDAASGGGGGHGNGGGGGGGGGGGTNGLCDSFGGGGGGGGGGGCAGGGGQGGASAGGSFAVYAWASTIVVENTLLRADGGGDGGAGGSGGQGGNGGFGGNCTGGSSSDPRGNCYGGSGDQDDASNGGRGGNGGQGGDGGHGGGGAGGPSIGVVRGGGTGLTLSGASFSLGAPGAGGPSSGNSGPGGIVTNVFTP